MERSLVSLGILLVFNLFIAFSVVWLSIFLMQYRFEKVFLFETNRFITVFEILSVSGIIIVGIETMRRLIKRPPTEGYDSQSHPLFDESAHSKGETDK